MCNQSWRLDSGYWIIIIGDILRFWVLINIHHLSLKLPRFELYEVGAQIRRSGKSVKSIIVEGYGRRRYKNEFVRFLVFAQASNDETLDHLETLYKTGSLSNESTYTTVRMDIIQLGKSINAFIQAIEKQHNNWK